jgi:hypothetical protein
MYELAVLVALSAPAPPAKAAPPKAKAIAAGAYVMLWRGQVAKTWFRGGPDEGFYHQHWVDGHWWEGKWTQKDGVLTVQEWRADDPTLTCRWSVKLDAGGVTGKEGGWNDWKLTPLKERVD